MIQRGEPSPAPGPSIGRGYSNQSKMSIAALVIASLTLNMFWSGKQTEAGLMGITRTLDEDFSLVSEMAKNAPPNSTVHDASDRNEHVPLGSDQAPQNFKDGSRTSTPDINDLQLQPGFDSDSSSRVSNYASGAGDSWSIGAPFQATPDNVAESITVGNTSKESVEPIQIATIARNEPALGKEKALESSPTPREDASNVMELSEEASSHDTTVGIIEALESPKTQNETLGTAAGPEEQSAQNETFDIGETPEENLAYNETLDVDETPEELVVQEATSNFTESVFEENETITTAATTLATVSPTTTPTSQPTAAPTKQVYEEGLYERRTPFEELFKPSVRGSGFPFVNETVAVCNFEKKGAWFHFPHAFQQLLRCFSWWQAPQNVNKHPVLMIEKLPSPSAFTTGFFEALQYQFGVELDWEGLYKNISVHVDAPDIFSTRPEYGLRVPHDATVLRDGLWKYYNVSKGDHSIAGCPALNVGNNASTAAMTTPKIGFLNRKANSGRHTSNYLDIIEAIEGHNFDIVGGNGHVGSIKVKYLESFDGMSFQEQVEFVASIDILIGPHGAQTTNSAFLPTCGGILEFFPKGYYIPRFFGTLARSTGHSHYNIYTGGNNRDAEMEEYMATLETRKIARSFEIIADPDVVVQATQELVDRWHNCCQRGPRPFGRRRRRHGRRTRL